MQKAITKTINEAYEDLKKSEQAPKLTPEEQREWLNLRILNQAKNELRWAAQDKNPFTINELVDKIYEGLVSDWPYNKAVLDACRNNKVDRQYVSDLVSRYFDADGNVIPDSIKERSFGGLEVKQSSPTLAYSEDGRAQYSLTSIDELHKCGKDLKSKKRKFGKAIPADEELDLKKKKGGKKKESC